MHVYTLAPAITVFWIHNNICTNTTEGTNVDLEILSWICKWFLIIDWIASCLSVATGITSKIQSKEQDALIYLVEEASKIS